MNVTHGMEWKSGSEWGDRDGFSPSSSHSARTATATGVINKGRALRSASADISAMVAAIVERWSQPPLIFTVLEGLLAAQFEQALQEATRLGCNSSIESANELACGKVERATRYAGPRAVRGVGKRTSAIESLPLGETGESPRYMSNMALHSAGELKSFEALGTCTWSVEPTCVKTISLPVSSLSCEAMLVSRLSSAGPPLASGTGAPHARAGASEGWAWV